MAKKKKRKAARKRAGFPGKRKAKKRKKPRSAAQKRATQKMLAANRKRRAAQKPKRRKTAKRKAPKSKARSTAAKRAAKYRRQRKAYAPLLSPEIGAQQAAHRAALKREAKALAAMKRELMRGQKAAKAAAKRAKAGRLTLAEKADLALLQLKGLVKAQPKHLQLALTGTKNPRKKKRKSSNAVRWWIADVYKGKRRKTYIDQATAAEAQRGAKALARAASRVELSGPYATRPTARTERR